MISILALVSLALMVRQLKTEIVEFLLFISNSSGPHTVDDDKDAIDLSLGSHTDPSFADIHHASESHPSVQIQHVLARPRISGLRGLWDGWVVGPNDELLLWIPPDLHLLWWPRTLMTIPSSYTVLNLSDFKHGPNWTECQFSFPLSDSPDDDVPLPVEQPVQHERFEASPGNAIYPNVYMIVLFSVSGLLVVVAWMIARVM
jgi:hypothetical protein